MLVTCQGTRQQSSTFTKHKITAQQEGQEAVAVVEEVEEEAVGECAGVALRSCTHREMPSRCFARRSHHDSTFYSKLCTGIARRHS